MKNQISSIIFFLLFIIALKSHAQTCWPDQSDSYWRIDEQTYGSKRIANCDPSYNCHQFVISYLEYGCNAVGWNNTMSGSYACPGTKVTLMPSNSNSSTYFSIGGKYIKVCSEAYSDFSLLKFPYLDTHSQIKNITYQGEVKYISKYGTQGPLVGHNLHGSWYFTHGSPVPTPEEVETEFWVYIGKIKGDSSITGTGVKSFYVENKTGIQYSWTIISGNSNIYISSGANLNQVQLNPSHSGSAILKLNIQSGCSSIISQQINLTIQTNVCLEGSYSNAGINNINLNTVNSIAVGGVSASVTCPTATSFIWQKTSGNINGWFPPGNNIAFTMTSGGSISFLVTAKSGSTTLATRNVTFYNYGSFMVYPNPSAGEFKIDLNNALSFDVVLSKLDSQEKTSFSDFKGTDSIDTSKLLPGEYSLRIFHEGKLVNQQHILINK